jgi:hypothetical protein
MPKSKYFAENFRVTNSFFFILTANCGKENRWYNYAFPTFRLSGSSDRPAYPGFIVIKTAQVGSSFSSVPSNTRISAPALIPVGNQEWNNFSNATYKCALCHSFPPVFSW